MSIYDWESEGGYVTERDECFACLVLEEVDESFNNLAIFLAEHRFPTQIHDALAQLREDMHGFIKD